MSRVDITGRVPAPQTILGVLDAEARKAIADTRNVAVPIARAEAPRRSGRLAGAVDGRISKTATGHQVTVAVKRGVPHGRVTAAKVARWVAQGTGVYRKGAGPKRPITGRRGVLGTMVLPGGRRVRSVKGQRPNPFLARAETRAAGPAAAAMRDGARRAADRLRRL